jgi:hypothetical protein
MKRMKRMKRSVLIAITLLVTLFAALWTAGLAAASRSVELRAPARPATDTGLTADEGSTGDAGVIAYAERSTGDIHVISPDGTNDRLLWDNPSSVVGIDSIKSLAWRLDGRELAFSGSHEQVCSWYESDVYAIGYDGSGYRRITNAPACAALAGLPKGAVKFSVYNWVGDSMWVYVQGAPELKPIPASYEGTVTFDDVADLGPGVPQHTVGIEGMYRYPGGEPYADVQPGQTVSGGSVIRTSAGGGRKGYGVGKVSWKVDGSALAYTMRTNTALRQIPANPPYGAIGVDLPVVEKRTPYLVAWGPTLATKDQYLYASNWHLLENNVAGIYLNTVGNASGGTQLVTIEDLTGRTILDVEWLPDGSGFLYSMRWVPLDICADIFEYDFATHEITKLTPNLVDKYGYGGARGLSISPDGQQIVFERAIYLTEADNSVWIINRDGTGLRMLANDAGRPAWSRVSAPPPLTATRTSTPTSTATSKSTATPTSTATRMAGTNRIYLPLVLKSFVAAPPTSTPTGMPAATATATPTRTPTCTPTATPTWKPTDTPTPTPSPTLANDGINGRVTHQGAAAAGIELELRFYDGANTTSAATTTTDSEGRYRFTGAASLDPGQEYWVRFLSPDNPAYVSIWQTASITAYTSGSSVPGGDFDIADVHLLSPPDGATQALPVTFTWQPRGIPGDTYSVVFWDLDTDDYWYTENLGNVGSFTATGLWQDVVFGKEYGWSVWVFNGPDSYGQSYYYQTITFVKGGAGFPAAPAAWQTGERLREPSLMGTRP